MAHPIELDFQFESATETGEIPVGIHWAAESDAPRSTRWERLRTWTAALAAVAAAVLLSGAGSSLDQKCADMSAGSWFHVEYCQPEAAPTQAWASIPVSEAWPAGDLAADLPIVAPPMTPVARSLRPQR